MDCPMCGTNCGDTCYRSAAPEVIDKKETTPDVKMTIETLKANFIFCTGDMNPVPFDKSDRRFCVINL